MDLTWILQWWNLIFIIPMGLAIAYLGLYVSTGITFGHADADVDADVGTDADVDADADVDTDVDADADVDAGADADADADAEAEAQAELHHDAEGSDHEQDTDQDGQGATGSSAVMDALFWLGAGRLPISLLLMLFAMFWGIAGFNLNRTLASSNFPEWAIPLVSVPAALLVSSLLTRWVARLFGRLLPMSSGQARRKDALVGSVGVALSPIDASFGLVMVRTSSGGVFQVPCRVSSDRPQIAKDQRVLLVDYDKSEDCFRVVPDELGRPELKQ